MKTNWNKRSGTIFLVVVLLTGCAESEEKLKSEGMMDQVEMNTDPYTEFNSDDGVVSFIILNDGSFSESTLIRIKRDTLHAYNEIRKITGFTNKGQEVFIELKKDNGLSHYWNGIIYLYNVDDEREALVHELVHALLGYDFKNAGYFTLDGLAMYLDKKITSNEPATFFSFNSHELMKFLREEEINLPIEKLIDPEIAFEMNDLRKQIENRWLFYVQTSSFSKLLNRDVRFRKIYADL
ncbi:hypothetical protein ACTWQL_07540 [Pseudalkalibacillus sp. R45]|uniref:hypothetical protein n=1 Tax=Pseudalkalibacillus sp. R45 TaxID=3457433 RepID=UPI003FCDA5B6